MKHAVETWLAFARGILGQRGLSGHYYTEQASASVLTLRIYPDVRTLSFRNGKRLYLSMAASGTGTATANLPMHRKAISCFGIGNFEKTNNVILESVICYRKVGGAVLLYGNAS